MATLDKSQVSITPPAVTPDQPVPSAPVEPSPTPAVPAKPVSTVTNPTLYNSMPYYGLAYPNYTQFNYAYPRIYQVKDPNVREVMPEVYRPQTFDSEKMFRAMYGSEASRRDRRKYRRYQRSDKYRADVDRFNAEENRKYLASIDAREAYRQRMWEDRIAQIPTEQKKSKYDFTQSVKWDNLAKKYGFTDREALADWQATNGLVADGKFGNKSLAVWNRLHGIGGGSPDGGKRPSGDGSKNGDTSPKKDQNTERVSDPQWVASMKAKGYKEVRHKDGSVRFEDYQGNQYYDTGRKQDVNKKMSNYNMYDTPTTAHSNRINVKETHQWSDWYNQMDKKKYKQIKLKDNSVAYQDNYGNTYFNTGRMKPKGGGKMVNYDYTKLK